MKNTTLSNAMAAAFLMTMMAFFATSPAAIGQTERQYWVYGVVTTPDGKPLPGVTIQFSGGLPAQVTDQAGRYTVSTPVELDQYTVTPSKTGYSFVSNQNPALILMDNAEVSFLATATESSAAVLSKPSGTTSPASAAVTVKKATVTYAAATLAASASTTSAATAPTAAQLFAGVQASAVTAVSGTTVLSNNAVVPGISGSKDSQKFYKITVPSGQSQLTISISSGTGDCDLYVKYGAAPTKTNWNYRPYLGGNNETVAVSNPTSGDWYIMLCGYAAYSGVTLRAAYVARPAVATPLISPASGTYTNSVSVTITCSTAGATIRYTTNGSTPTSSSPAYAYPFTLTSSATVCARAFKLGMADSNAASATYQIPQKVATPIISPGSMNFTSMVMVTMTCATSGATVRYTTNGMDATSSSAIYTAPIKVLKTTTLKARAFKSGMTDSAAASATYTVPVKYVTLSRSYHRLLSSPVSAQNLFTGGAALLLKDDDGDGNGDVNDDVSLDVRFYIPNAIKATFPNQSASTFPAAERYDYTLAKYNDVPNSTVAIQLLAARFAMVKQVNSLPGWYGVTITNNRASMILAQSAPTMVGVHEWGHLCGLPDYYSSADSRRIMYGYGNSVSCEINVSERAAMSAY